MFGPHTHRHNPLYQILCASILCLLYQLKVSEAIRQRFQLLYVSHDLHTILSHEILDVALSAYRGPQDFNTLYRRAAC